MTYKEETILKACDVLEEHNRTGFPVMTATKGKWTEMGAYRVVLTSCRELLEMRKRVAELVK